MRSMLLHIHDDDCLEPRRQVALDLARAFSGHVTCLQSAPIEASYGDYYGTAFAQVMPIIEKGSSALRNRVEGAMRQEDVPWNWVFENFDAYGAIRQHAPMHDLLVLGACDFRRGSKGYSALAADLAIDLRTPVMLVGEDSGGYDPAKPIVLAWNGSAEAANAMRAAVPLLAMASKVIVVTIEEKDDHWRVPATAAAAYLSRHAIAAEVAEEPVLKTGIASTLRHLSDRLEAGLIVMGAYGRTRFHELVLGGVSRDMFSNVATPLFLAH